MLHFPLDFIDSIDVKRRTFAHRCGDSLRDQTLLLHGFGCEGLYLQPDAEFGFGRPNGCHFGTGVSGDHGVPRGWDSAFYYWLEHRTPVSR